MTTPYDIKIAPIAHRQFLTQPPKVQKDILRLLDALSVNPRPPGTKKIEGLMGLYANPMDGLRLVYKIEDQVIFLLLIK
jgi:mRNA interferase RelE/StbE